MAIDKPQQRIPLGSVTIGGTEYPVTISTPYYRVLFSYFNALGGSSGATVPDLDAALQYDVREADWAELEKRVRDIERDEWEYASPADVAQVAARVDAFAGDEPAALLAQVAELTKRVAELEAQLSMADNLGAQVAQLAAQIRDIQSEMSFA